MGVSKKPILWITYAWLDNEDNDVDFIVSELTKAGLDVRIDRIRLLAGKRLWDQIDQNIADPDLNAWAIYVTENSLKSEPCLEELSYALDRALRSKDGSFKIIGIFPSLVDRKLIPSAIATRRYVNLKEVDWKERIVAAVKDEMIEAVPNDLPEYGHKLHTFEAKPVLEVWPRIGTWVPNMAAVNFAEASLLQSIIQGPRGYINGSGMIYYVECEWPGHRTIAMSNPVSSDNTMHIFLEGLPSQIWFGGVSSGKERVYGLKFAPIVVPSRMIT